MQAIPGNDRPRCRACEDQLGPATYPDPAKYGIDPRFRVIMRRCNGCSQLWLGYMLRTDPDHKIIMKMIDKVL